MAQTSDASAAAGRAVLFRRMLESQAYREAAAVDLFKSAAPLTPDAAAAATLREQIREEQEHYAAVAKIWCRATGEGKPALARIVRDRMATRPLPKVHAWWELGLAQWLYDRAGFFQLSACCDSVEQDYAAMCREIVEEEAGHLAHGADALVAALDGLQGRSAADGCVPLDGARPGRHPGNIPYNIGTSRPGGTGLEPPSQRRYGVRGTQTLGTWRLGDSGDGPRPCSDGPGCPGGLCHVVARGPSVIWPPGQRG